MEDDKAVTRIGDDTLRAVNNKIKWGYCFMIRRVINNISFGTKLVNAYELQDKTHFKDRCEERHIPRDEAIETITNGTAYKSSGGRMLVLDKRSGKVTPNDLIVVVDRNKNVINTAFHPYENTWELQRGGLYDKTRHEFYPRLPEPSRKH